MRNSTRFSILGPVQIRAGDVAVTVAAPRERVLLALLLLREGHLVPVQQLIAALWDVNPPLTARAQVHSCVSRLRQLLRKVGLSEDLITTEPAGYRIKVGIDELDSVLFATRVERGRTAYADGDLTSARDELRSALALWRGRPLTDVDSDVVRAAAAHLGEQWNATMALCLDIELQLGLAEEVLAEVADLVERYPHHEQFRAHLMTALARTGRRADALAVFRRGRAHLAEELGIEPGAELVELHRRILNGDVSLLLPQAAQLAAARPARCLPRDLVDFAGRVQAVQDLVDAVRLDSQTVLAIDGMPGTGKTSLAVRVAHMVSDGYPDGHLFLDLHGHSERAPLDPIEAFGALLRQLGVPGERVPPGLDERALLWRTELATRRILVVLDNALDTAQVLPLLPGAAHTATIITSRRRLPGLDGVQPLSLDVLSLDDAVELLRRTVGDRVRTDPACAAEVAELCGRLPLAVRLAGARLQHRPTWTVADLAVRLRAADRRLAELAVDGRTVAAAFTLSYQQLAVPMKKVFRVLGLHPAGDFEAAAVAALADRPVPETTEILEGLVDAHLVEAPTADRYRLHDLLRDYAAQLAEPESGPAIDRLLEHYLCCVINATQFMTSEGTRDVLRVVPHPPTAHRFTTIGDARRWLDRELPNIISMARLADETGRHRHTCLIPCAVSPFLYGVGFNVTFVTLYQRAVAAATALGDAEMESTSLNFLAAVQFRLGGWVDALANLGRSVAIAQREGLNRLQASVLANKAMVHVKLGQYTESIAALEAAIAMFPDDTPDGLLYKSANAAGCAFFAMGRYEEALAQQRRAVAAAHNLADERQIAVALGELGLVHLHLGHLTVAGALLHRAVALKRQASNRFGAAESLSKLGSVYRIQGRLADAIACQRAALRQMEQVADASGQCSVLNDLALSLRATGALPEATELNTEALHRTGQIGDRYEQARALAGLGRMAEAEALFRELGARNMTALFL